MTFKNFLYNCFSLYLNMAFPNISLLLAILYSNFSSYSIHSNLRSKKRIISCFKLYKTRCLKLLFLYPKLSLKLVNLSFLFLNILPSKSSVLHLLDEIVHCVLQYFLILLAHEFMISSSLSSKQFNFRFRSLASNFPKINPYH
jgi:hypothetical protein